MQPNQTQPPEAPTDSKPAVNDGPTVIGPQQSGVPSTQNNGSPIAGIETYTTSQHINNQPTSFSSQTTSKKKFFKTPTFVAIAIVLLLLGGSGAAYFGYVVPNKPENLWGTSMVRMGKGYDKLADYVKDYTIPKGDKLTGSFKVSGDYTADGSIDLLSQGANSHTKLSVSYSGIKANAEIITIASTGDSPDVYFKVSGVSGIETLLGPELASKVGSLNDQWYFADHSLADQYLSNLGSAGKEPQITKDNVNELINAIRQPTQQYVFTNDDKKMVFVIKDAVGKEKLDGRNTYHYKIGVNKANLKAYNTALCDSTVKTKIGSLLLGDTRGDCKDTSDIDSIKDTDTADVWVDTHTKLVHKVRFSDKSNSNNYYDVFQDYQGGGTIPFGIGFASKDGNNVITGTLKMSLNMDNNVFKMTGDLKATGDTKLTGSLDLTLAPNSQQLKVEKPANVKNIMELLNDLGYSDLINAHESANNESNDSQRKTDIAQIQAELAAYSANNMGAYPTFAQINDSNWRASNFFKSSQGSNLWFEDPASNSQVLVAAPAAHVYSYSVSPAGCDNSHTKCTAYSLTATLDDGSAYTKTALN